MGEGGGAAHRPTLAARGLAPTLEHDFIIIIDINFRANFLPILSPPSPGSWHWLSRPGAASQPLPHSGRRRGGDPCGAGGRGAHRRESFREREAHAPGTGMRCPGSGQPGLQGEGSWRLCPMGSPRGRVGAGLAPAGSSHPESSENRRPVLWVARDSGRAAFLESVPRVCAQRGCSPRPFPAAAFTLPVTEPDRGCWAFKICLSP